MNGLNDVFELLRSLQYVCPSILRIISKSGKLKIAQQRNPVAALSNKSVLCRSVMSPTPGSQ
jgi:hypothetical protein